MANKIFIVPIETVEDESVGMLRQPKYVDRVDGYSGTTFEFPEDTVLPFAGEEMYIVRFFASEQTLTDIEGLSDAYTRQEYDIPKLTVTEWLNEKTGNDYTFTEWLERFNVSQPA